MGKRFQSDTVERVGKTPEVSIPFKRESVSKVFIGDFTCTFTLMMFQFPSNGKAFPKVDGHFRGMNREIKFPFPSNGKGFQSIAKWDNGIAYISFQFPSNGKGFPKSSHLGFAVSVQFVCVSIPFKRESVSKVAGEGVPNRWIEFQFPSNGKAFPK